MSEPTKTPAVWKQVLGAVAGAVIALGGYTVYDWAEIDLGAYIVLPGGVEVSSEGRPRPETLREEVMSRQAEVIARAQQIASEMRASAAASSAAAMAATTSSDASGASSSAYSSRARIARAESMKSGAPRAATLPDSGAPIIGVIGAALGASVVRRKRLAEQRA